MYAIKTHHANVCKAKGVVKALRNKLTINDYKTVLFKRKRKVRKQQNLIRAVHHNVYTFEQNKIILDFDDDKRYICESGIDTLAHGHYKIINSISEECCTNK